MPTPQEQELLELVQQDRARNEPAPTNEPLPDLDPGLFLSNSGVREVQAAQQLGFGGGTRGEFQAGALSVLSPVQEPLVPNANGDVFGPGVVEGALEQLIADQLAPIMPSRRITTMVHEQAQAYQLDVSIPQPRCSAFDRAIARAAADEQALTGVSVTALEGLSGAEEMAQLESIWSTAPTGEDDSYAAPAATNDEDAVLGSLWGSTVPEGAVEHAMASGIEPVEAPWQFQGGGDEVDIQFDEPQGFERAGPTAGRFQVGRQSPPAAPRIPRQASLVDGQVVSRRGSDGAFRRVQPPPPRPRPAPARPVPQPAPFDRASIPSAMERLGSNPWD